MTQTLTIYQPQKDPSSETLPSPYPTAVKAAFDVKRPLFREPHNLAVHGHTLLIKVALRHKVYTFIPLY